MSSENEDNIEGSESPVAEDEGQEEHMELEAEKSAELEEVDSSSEEEAEESKMDATEETSAAADVDHSSPEPEAKEEKDSEDVEPEETPVEQESAEPDTELVSEDEFPSDGVKLETEAVSDEELQEPPANDLETEAVSDDELPPVKKKRKHRRHSGSEDEHSSSDKKKKRRRRSSDDKKSRRSRSRGKERKHEKSGKSSSKSRSSRSRDSSPRRKTPKPSSKSTGGSKSKVLPELEKYWKAVRDDPSDFTGWTYLLQYVDQENDVEAAREAYDSFLRIYPYCYGYWRKYADYEKHKGDKSRCEEVFSRGLKSIPLSVDLWLHYLNFCKATMKENESLLREQFEKAIERCGLEFRSDRLWDFYIKWESDLKNYQNVFAIYDRLLKTPVLGFKTHFENFEDFVRSYQPNRILSVDEFLELRAEAVQKIKEKGVTADPSAALPPGDDPNEEEPSPARADEETTLVREKIIALRKKVFKNTANEVAKRWKFEEGIKRPYFHVKPLETAQVNSWRDYLDFEIANGDMQRTVILFERCLIACALYEEFWLKYIRYLESNGENDPLVRNVYQRACLIHHSKKPYLALDWATFEESRGNIEGARKVLNQAEKQVPNLLLIFVRRINLERRVKNLEGAAKLYEYYLKNNSRNKNIYVSLSAKYARFCHLGLNDANKGIEILKKAIDKYPDELKLYVCLLDLYMAKRKSTEECLSVFNKILSRESIDPETKIIFAQRKIEFLEDFGADIKQINRAHLDYSAFMKQIDRNKNGPNRDDKSDDARGKGKSDSGHGGSQSHPTNSTGGSGYSGSNYNSSYQGNQNYTGSGSGQYPQASYNAPPNNQYGSSDQSSNYQNWNYSQSNYNNSNQSWGGYNYYS